MRGSRFISAVGGMITAGVLIVGTGFFSCAEELYRHVDTNEKIYDYAELLTEEEEEEIHAECIRLSECYGYDVFVVTIDDNNAPETADRSLTFLEDFGDENGFGMGEECNYAAFLIDMDERQYSLDIKGDTCFLIYSDQVQDDILDDVYPDMAAGDYCGAIHTFLRDVDSRGTKEVSEFVGSEEEYADYQKEKRGNALTAELGVALVQALFFGIVAGALAVFGKRRKSKNVHIAGNASAYVEAGSYRLTEKEDRFLRRYQTVRVIESSSGGGGSSGSHHTTTHSSSGGSSHSGGSRSF